MKLMRYTLLLNCLIVSVITNAQVKWDIDSTIINEVSMDRSAMNAVLKNDFRSILSPTLGTQTGTGLSFGTDPILTNYGFGSHKLFGLVTGVQESDSSITTANYTYGLSDSHHFIGDYLGRVGTSYLSIGLNRRSEIGQFQNSNIKRTDFYVALHKKETRMQTRYGYLHNSLSLEDNGGLNDTLQLESLADIDYNSLPVNLNTGLTTIRRKTLFYSTYYKLNREESDTMSRKYEHGFGLDLKLSNEEYNYELDVSDFSSVWLDTTFQTSTGTMDSLGFKALRTSLSYGIIDPNKRKLVEVEYTNSTHDWNVLNSSYARINIHQYLKGSQSLQYKYYTSGLYLGSQELTIRSDHRLFDHVLLNFLLSYENKSANYMERNYRGNHFSWLNSFEKVQKKKLQLYLFEENSKLGLSANLEKFDNYIYYNEFSLPEQSTESILYGKFTLYHLFRSKHLTSYSKVKFQRGNTSVLRYPDISLSSKINYLFKLGQIHMSLGVQALYFTEYYSLNYNPNLRNFYLQNSTKAGGYPFVDLYVSAKVGSVDLFLKKDNVFYKNITSNAFLYPGYSSTPSIVRVGLNWVFQN